MQLRCKRMAPVLLLDALLLASQYTTMGVHSRWGYALAHAALRNLVSMAQGDGREGGR